MKILEKSNSIYRLGGEGLNGGGKRQNKTLTHSKKIKLFFFLLVLLFSSHFHDIVKTSTHKTLGSKDMWCYHQRKPKRMDQVFLKILLGTISILLISFKNLVSINTIGEINNSDSESKALQTVAEKFLSLPKYIQSALWVSRKIINLPEF